LIKFLGGYYRMKKRFLCLVMCILMLLPMVLTSCSDSTGKGDETTSSSSSSSSKAMTVTLYTITEKSTTEEALAMVEDAINEITEADFNTHVILRATTADKYEKLISTTVADIEEQIRIAEEEAAAKKAAEKAARQAAKNAAKNGQTTTAVTTTAETTTEADTIINDLGLEETVYPEEDGTQLDIFLINSYEMFAELQEAGHLAALDEQLGIGAKIIKSYINNNYINGAKVKSKTYGIPNNHVFGDYQYLLLNKEVFDGLYYDFDNITEFSDLEEFYKDVIEYRPDVIPMLGEFDGNIHYLDGRPSLIGAMLPADVTESAQPVNLFNNISYMAYFNTMQALYAANGVVLDGSLEDGNVYASAVINGDYNIPALYEEDYYILPLRYPTADEEEIFGGMYAISAHTKDVARCMDIVTYLSTNADFVNLFTYGIEDVHYTVDPISKIVTKINDDYSMNMRYTGNQFLMYANSDMDEKTLGLAANNWELAKLQNLDMVLHPYLGFVLAHEKEDLEDKKKQKEAGIKNPVGKMIDIQLYVDEEKDPDTFFTIQQALDIGVELYAEYMPKLKEFQPEWREVEKLQTQLDPKTGRRKQVTVIEKEWYGFEDFYNEMKRELIDHPLMKALSTEDEYTLANQYLAWFATIKR